MTKDELIRDVAGATEVSVADVKSVIEATMKSIKDSLAAGDNVTLRGFGSFIRVKRASKIVRDIQRNTTMELAARIIPKFKPAKEFTEKIR